MSNDTVFLPPEQRAVRRRGGVFVPPLLIVSFVLYNLAAFLFFGGQPEGWDATVFRIPMVSGMTWNMNWGDLLIVISLGLLFVEILKSTRTGTSSILEHMLSTLVFVLFLVEFLLVGAAASSVFFILMIMALVDLTAGFTVSISGAGRDVTLGN